MTTVVIVDDHSTFRSGLRADLAPDLTVLGEASSVATALALLATVSPEVVLLDVHLPDGTVFVNPLRVLPNDAGSEVVFTVFRRDGVDDDAFDADAAAVAADLATLKRLLES